MAGNLWEEAAKVADEIGLCYVHPSDDGPAEYAVIRADRLTRIYERLFPPRGEIPVSDPEWLHEHVTPEIAEEAAR